MAEEGLIIGFPKPCFATHRLCDPEQVTCLLWVFVFVPKMGTKETWLMLPCCSCKEVFEAKTKHWVEIALKDSTRKLAASSCCHTRATFLA